MLGWRIRDALLDRLVLRPHQHFVLLGTAFNFGTTGCGRLLYGRFGRLVHRFGERLAH